MDYRELVTWLETPGTGKPRAQLEEFRSLMKLLGDPQDRLRFVHVTGSNGKGSICAMMAGILQEAGYRTALYTSPHLSVYNERCLVNGEMIPDGDFFRLAERVRALTEPSAFSWGMFYKMTAIGLLYFAEQRCDIVVLEVGRGGSRDCTNLVEHTDLALIGHIGLEHTEVLGDTLAKIADQKAGILKPGCSAVLYAQSEEVEQVVAARAAALGCPLRITRPELLEFISFDRSGQVMRYGKGEPFRLSLTGTYQLENAAVVLEGVRLLREKGWQLPDGTVRQALGKLYWPGRFEILREEPLIFGDGAHNSSAVEQLTACFRRYVPGQKLRFILTLLWDRNWQEMLDMLAPFARDFIAVEVEDHKALHAAELAGYIRESLHFPAVTADSEAEALRLALSHEDGAPVCVMGSIYLLGAIRDLLKEKA